MTILNRPLLRRIVLVALGILFIASASVIVAYSALAPSDGVTLAVGQVAPADIRAPRSLTYESEVLTKLARQAASDVVRDVYDPPNPGVLRQQVQIARLVLDFIDNIRHDSYATRSQQVADLKAISAIKVDDDLSLRLLNVPDTAWKDIDNQVMSILERAMRNEIREDDLKAVYANLPNLVSVSVDETQVALIVELLRGLIKPNTFFNDERTREARRLAALVVPAETRSFVQGQVVVRAGSIVTPADLEALTQLRLLQPADRRLQALVGAFLAVLVSSILGTLYMRRFYPDLFHNVPQMVLIGGLFLIFLAGSRLFSVNDEFQSRLYPAAAFALIMVALTEQQAATMLNAALGALIGLVLGNSLEFAALVAIGGTAGVLTLNRVDRLNAYFVSGLVIGVVNITISLFFMMLQGTTDPGRVLTVVSAGLVNGAASAGLAIVGLYIIGNMLNRPTSVRLLELSQPNQPLLQRLLREAPGTYQHSLQVANLGELAAERIGASAPLVRVAALYHDIGKIVAPAFFVENQVEGLNPHSTLAPEDSARIIISHVTEGEKLARKYRLPGVLIDLILQHHGTTKVVFFYSKALEAARGDESRVNRALFTYPGPIPQTREAAVLMLADASESIARAKRPATRQEIERIVLEIVETRLAEGQLDASRLTLNDLKTIRDSFVSSLQGIFHPRIAYPALPPSTAQEMAALPPESSATLPPPTQHNQTAGEI